MWVVIIFYVGFFPKIFSMIDLDQQRYLKKINMKCGIETEDKTAGWSARVVNGKPSLNTYSWMVKLTKSFIIVQDS